MVLNDHLQLEKPVRSEEAQFHEISRDALWREEPSSGKVDQSRIPFFFFRVKKWQLVKYW